MKKSKILFLLLIFFALKASAGVEDITLVVELRDGSCTSFLLADKPRITFSVDQMNVVSDFFSAEFERRDVKMYRFLDETSTAVCNAPAESKALVENNTLIVCGVADDTAVTICNVNGVVVKQAIGVADSCTVSLNDIVSGFYLVKFNNTTFKFFKK